MAITFDGQAKLITLSAGTTTLDVKDLYSRWKDWVVADNANSKWPQAFTPVGGEDIDVAAGTKVPPYIFMLNNWKIKPQEAHHTLKVTAGILLDSGGGDPFVNTNGNYVVRVNYQQPVQAITVNTGGTIAPTQQQIRDAMALATAQTPAAGSIDTKIDSVSLVAVGAALNVRAASFVTPPVKGTVVSGTYLDTYDLNGIYHQITHDAGDIEVEYEMNVGADFAPVSVTVIGRMHGAQNSAQIQAYHWGDQLFRQVGTLAGKVQDVTTSVTLFIAHVGTGVDAGRVRIKFLASGVNNDLYIDQLWVSYAPLGAFNSADRTRLTEVSQLQGLTNGVPLVVTQTSRTAGGIAQTIEETNGTVTVTRQ